MQIAYLYAQYKGLAKLGCSDALGQIYNGQSPNAPLVQGSLRCCQYQQGKLAFDVLSLLYGAGEVKLAAASTQIINRVGQFTTWYSRLNLPSSLLLRPLKKGLTTTLLAITLTATPVAEANAFVGVTQTVDRVLAAEMVSLPADLSGDGKPGYT